MSRLDTIEARAAVAGAHPVASITVTEDERRARRLAPDKLDEAKRLFRENGYLRVVDLFDPATMARLDAEFRRRHARKLAGTRAADKRPLFSVAITGAFNDPDVLTSPLILPLLAEMLGEDFIIATLSAVVSFPGAPNQHLHRDSKPLFSPDNSVERGMPPVAMNMLVPLIDFTTETGCTRVWPGSHRIAGLEEGLAVGSLDPEVRVGSVLLSDGRLLHRGAENRSGRVRPLFYLQFHRSWFRDFWGYENRRPILISRRDHARMAPEFRARFDWSRDPYRWLELRRAGRFGKRLAGQAMGRLLGRGPG